MSQTNYRVLLLIPLAMCIVLAIGVTTTSVGDARLLFYRYEVIFVKTLATAGCLYAAFGFHRGDYLRRAWILLGFSYFLLLAIDLFFAPPAHTGVTGFSPTVMRLRGSIVLLSNLAAVAGLFMLARTWREAGLEPPGSPLSRRLMAVGFAVVTMVVVGQSIYFDTRDLAAGNLQGFAGIASDLGDLISLCLIAPVLWTALALRGGVLVWPWLLLSAAQIGWLLYDAAGTLGYALHLEHGRLRPVEELFRSLACTMAMISGVAQRWAISGRKQRD